jgi:hypothetical protein
MDRNLWKVVHTAVVHGYEDGSVVWVEPGQLIELSDDEAAKLGDNLVKAEKTEESEAKPRRRR